jgi:hypothetical protein
MNPGLERANVDEHHLRLNTMSIGSSEDGGNHESVGCPAPQLVCKNTHERRVVSQVHNYRAWLVLAELQHQVIGEYGEISAESILLDLDHPDGGLGCLPQAGGDDCAVVYRETQVDPDNTGRGGVSAPICGVVDVENGHAGILSKNDCLDTTGSGSSPGGVGGGTGMETWRRRLRYRQSRRNRDSRAISEKVESGGDSQGGTNRIQDSHWDKGPVMNGEAILR